MSEWDDMLYLRAQQLGLALKNFGGGLVLAESCTGGLVSMALTSVPGVSEFFCGSAVTYRNDTKTQWLNVSSTDLANPEVGPVSRQVAEQMCRGVLRKTPEAELAAAVTGHLGPQAPEGLDGVIYIAVGFRQWERPRVERHTLSTHTESTLPLRHIRQREAGLLVLQAVLAVLEPPPAMLSP